MKKLNENCLKSIYGGPIDPFALIDGCFEEGTLVTTQNGQKEIEKLNLATDKIWNPISEQWMSLSRRTVTVAKGTMYTITTASGTVTTTDNHPFMLMSGEVVKASELNTGDLLATAESGDLITNIAINPIEDYILVYNLVYANVGEQKEDHFVEVNGVVSGVLFLQDQVAHRTPLATEQMN